jgi:hypothetical protein
MQFFAHAATTLRLRRCEHFAELSPIAVLYQPNPGLGACPFPLLLLCHFAMLSVGAARRARAGCVRTGWIDAADGGARYRWAGAGSSESSGGGKDAPMRYCSVGGIDRRARRHEECVEKGAVRVGRGRAVVGYKRGNEGREPRPHVHRQWHHAAACGGASLRSNDEARGRSRASRAGR